MQHGKILKVQRYSIQSFTGKGAKKKAGPNTFI
jgi:hypothetical protein